MLDKKKIRLMAKASIYEKKYGGEDLKINSYFQKDYISLNIWITLIWITAGYAAAGGLFALCAGEALIEELTVFRLIILIAIAAAVYLILLIIYGVCAGSFYKRKYIRSKQRVKKYLRDLSRIEKMNMKKEIDRE